MIALTHGVISICMMACSTAPWRLLPAERYDELARPSESAEQPGRAAPHDGDEPPVRQWIDDRAFFPA